MTGLILSWQGKKAGQSAHEASLYVPLLLACMQKAGFLVT